MTILSGKSEHLPYSLSRWTDLPHGKWDWFKQQLDQGYMVAFDGRTAMPGRWSLRPEDTFGLVFWTKDPTNLIRDARLLEPYPLKIHVTITGWQEEEFGVPDLQEAKRLLQEALDVFGPERVVWRFSPVPLLDDPKEVLERFKAISDGLVGLREVYVSYLHENDRIPETRSAKARRDLLTDLALAVQNLTVTSCNLDSTEVGPAPNLAKGVCESGLSFGSVPHVDTCGCSLSVDPFTINEACSLNCSYCFAFDRKLCPSRRNTTRGFGHG